MKIQVKMPHNCCGRTGVFCIEFESAGTGVIHSCFAWSVAVHNDTVRAVLNLLELELASLGDLDLAGKI